MYIYSKTFILEVELYKKPISKGKKKAYKTCIRTNALELTGV